MFTGFGEGNSRMVLSHLNALKTLFLLGRKQWRTYGTWSLFSVLQVIGIRLEGKLFED